MDSGGDMKKFKKVKPAESEQEIVYEFAGKIAVVMDELKSSHIYFVIQQALGDISWEEAQDILDNIIAITGFKKTSK